jgi:hypothetical protein
MWSLVAIRQAVRLLQRSCSGCTGAQLNTDQGLTSAHQEDNVFAWKLFHEK